MLEKKMVQLIQQIKTIFRKIKFSRYLPVQLREDIFDNIQDVVWV